MGKREKVTRETNVLIIIVIMIICSGHNVYDVQLCKISSFIMATVIEKEREREKGTKKLTIDHHHIFH